MMMGALALLAVSAQAKDLYVLDFANGEQCKPNPAREWKIAADGKSIRYASASWGMVGFSLGRLSTCASSASPIRTTTTTGA